ncbi:hypothetical protein ACP275_10G044600 [Erythranthe tilingii]
MKALSKPLNSPGRTDKFPPPLMRFLRSNVGSRSRGKSRSSPMFYLRTRKTLPGPTEPTQEPTSPKVTCIGQVRVRRSSSKSKSNPKKPAGKVTLRRRCRRWLKIKTLLCGKSSPTFTTKRPFRRIFNKWGSFFRSGYCKKNADATEDSLRKKIENKEKVDASVYNSNNNNNNNNHRTNSSTSGESEYSVNKYENIGGGSLKFLECSSSSSTPPTNALILTRCRSAPYRSSSLGGIFWASAFAHQEVENVEKLEEVEVEVEEKAVVICRKSSEKSEKNVEDLKRVNVHPLVLMRCKSEPARTGERLHQEDTAFSRLDNVVDSRSHPNS